MEEKEMEEKEMTNEKLEMTNGGKRGIGGKVDKKQK